MTTGLHAPTMMPAGAPDDLVRISFARPGRPSIEISIDGGGDLPWQSTFSFLNDLYAMMAAA